MVINNGEKLRVVTNGTDDHNCYILVNSDLDKKTAYKEVLDAVRYYFVLI